MKRPLGRTSLAQSFAFLDPPASGKREVERAVMMLTRKPSPIRRRCQSLARWNKTGRSLSRETLLPRTASSQESEISSMPLCRAPSNPLPLLQARPAERVEASKTLVTPMRAQTYRCAPSGAHHLGGRLVFEVRPSTRIALGVQKATTVKTESALRFRLERRETISSSVAALPFGSQIAARKVAGLANG